GERRSEAAARALAAGCPKSGDADVCEASLAALEDHGSDAARASVETVLRTRGVADSARHKALKILKKQDRARLAAAIPDVVAEYRSLDDGFAVAAIEAVPELGLTQVQDITILIAKDGVAKRRVRVAALNAAEKLQHPALWTAYVDLITDSDAKIRVNSARGLGRSGVPGSVAVPQLTKAARTDADGNVRAAAMSALRFYAHPGLLPTLHDAVLLEKNVFAWGHAMELLLVLADRSSVPTLTKVLDQGGETMIPESLVRVIQTLVRVGDPAAVPALESLARRTKEDVVRQEADAAIRLLKGPEPERVRIIETYTVVEVHTFDPVAPAPPMPTLAVSVGPDGMAVWANVP
ncbi:MAG: HEAT repeat domain-containing protein, partial [Myxococcota bacterium]